MGIKLNPVLELRRWCSGGYGSSLELLQDCHPVADVSGLRNSLLPIRLVALMLYSEVIADIVQTQAC